MKTPAFLLCPAIFILAACSSGSSMMPKAQRAPHGQVIVSFKIPIPPAATSSEQRRPQYFSVATTTIALALKSVNGTLVNFGTQGNIFDLSKICFKQNGLYYYCSTTITVLSGDDVLGVLAYSTKPLGGNTSGNSPLSFAEGEVVIGSGSTAEPAGAEDTTGRLSVILAPIIYGGQVAAGPNPQPNSLPITLSNFVDAGPDVIPDSAYQTTPAFANTPHLTDSDKTGLTYLMDATSGQQGSDVAITSPTDQITLINTAKETASQKVTATLTYNAAADADATFTIPPYFQLPGSIAAKFTVPPPNSTNDLTFTCTAAGCTKGS